MAKTQTSNKVKPVVKTVKATKEQLLVAVNKVLNYLDESGSASFGEWKELDELYKLAEIPVRKNDIVLTVNIGGDIEFPQGLDPEIASSYEVIVKVAGKVYPASVIVEDVC